jgi:hypothetical protein
LRHWLDARRRGEEAVDRALCALGEAVVRLTRSLREHRPCCGGASAVPVPPYPPYPPYPPFPPYAPFPPYPPFPGCPPAPCPNPCPPTPMPLPPPPPSPHPPSWGSSGSSGYSSGVPTTGAR